MTIPGRDGEVREDHRQHEDVVDRQAALDHVAGQVLGGSAAAPPRPHDPREGDRQREPHDRPDSRLAHPHRYGAAMEYEQVDQQHCEHRGGEDDPDPNGCHERPFFRRVPKVSPSL